MNHKHNLLKKKIPTYKHNIQQVHKAEPNFTNESFLSHLLFVLFF